MMSRHMVRDRLQSASAALDDAPVKHLHFKEPSSIPSVLRGADAFTITRMESSNGLAERITKISSVPALLVAVSAKSLAIADCQFWVDDKPVPTPYIPGFRSNVIDLDAQPGCWVGNAFSTHRWLVQRRIERSQDLLIRTRESLSDIADLAGFADQAAFTRTFHQIVGMSPGRWRRDHQRR